MALAKQTITVLDPGLGLIEVAADTPICTGTCSLGPVGVMLAFSSLQIVKSTLGVGELAEAIAKELSERGGPVLAVVTTGSVAATSSAVTKAGTGTPTPTIAGTALMRTKTLVTVKVGGTLGTAQFVYSHDNFDPAAVNPTASTQRFIPTGGTYVFPNIGVTMTFPAGTYVAGDTYSFATEPAHSNAADIAAAAAVITASVGSRFATWTVTESFTTAVEGYAVATALGSQLQTLFQAYRFARGFCDVGSGDTAANVIAARAAFSDRRVSPWYGYEIVSSPLAFEGYANRLASCVVSGSSRANRVAPSSDLARYAEGALTGTQYIYQDSNLDSTVDAVNISTLRTWPGVPGFFIGAGYLAAAPGSDFIYFQYGRLMDIACNATYQAMLQFLSDDLRTLAGGTLDPLDGAVVNVAGQGALNATLLRPQNGRGLPGLVSAATFTTGLTNDFASDSTLYTNTAIRPRGYARFISQSLGFSPQ